MNIKVKWEFLKKSEIPKTLLEALGACGRDSFPNIHLYLLLAAHYYIKCRSRTILRILLNEKDQEHTQDRL